MGGWDTVCPWKPEEGFDTNLTNHHEFPRGNMDEHHGDLTAEKPISGLFSCFHIFAISFRAPPEFRPNDQAKRWRQNVQQQNTTATPRAQATKTSTANCRE